MRTLTGLMLVAGLIGLLSTGGMAWAKTTWIDDIANSVSFYKTNYPNSNWESYSHELRVLRHAIERGDKQAVKIEMNRWFEMLHAGITIQEYGVAVPDRWKGSAN
jgi:hypothetical protein